PFEAERRARQFVDFDRRSLAALADAYDPDVPIHENKEYLERFRKIREENAALLKGHDTAYSTGTDLGWSPPSLEDVEAERSRG
ncbi:MAG: hypothetical protein AAF483_09450, partial [Planctomycetota bacterium]